MSKNKQVYVVARKKSFPCFSPSKRWPYLRKRTRNIPTIITEIKFVYINNYLFSRSANDCQSLSRLAW